MLPAGLALCFGTLSADSDLLYPNWYNKIVSGELLSVNEAGLALGVSRRRAEALISSGVLPAERVGGRWVVAASSVRRLDHLMWREAGRPLSQATAWNKLEHELQGGSNSRAELDRRRRQLRSRAEHNSFYVHLSQLEKLANSSDIVVSGRRAAIAMGVPVDDDDNLDIYVRDNDAGHIQTRFGARRVTEGDNVIFHVVKESAWPFSPQTRFADGWITWLDLADREDRAADTVLDRVIGGRVRD